MKKKQEYLSDGVYVAWDGFHIVLSVKNPENKVVFLEPPVFEKLVEYYASIDTFHFSNPFPERNRISLEELRKEMASENG